MRRIIAIIILLVFVLTGCSPAEEPVNYIPENYNELVPIEIEEAVNAVWAQEYVQLSSHRYYGTYGDCVVWFQHGILPAIETKEIAGEEFYYRYLFNIYVYRKGKILSLEEAYKKRYLNKDQIKLLAEFHAASIDYPMGVRVYVPEVYGDKIPGYLQQNIADAWVKYKGEPLNSDPIYYGKYSFLTVILVPTGESTGVTSQTIGGHEFKYSGDFELMAHLHDQLMLTLTEAVESGYIKQEWLSLIAQFHRENNAALYEDSK